jgi:hypothetical protein
VGGGGGGEAELKLKGCLGFKTECLRPKVGLSMKADMSEHAWMAPNRYIYATVMLLATVQ